MNKNILIFLSLLIFQFGILSGTANAVVAGAVVVEQNDSGSGNPDPYAYKNLSFGLKLVFLMDQGKDIDAAIAQLVRENPGKTAEIAGALTKANKSNAAAIASAATKADKSAAAAIAKAVTKEAPYAAIAIAKAVTKIQPSAATAIETAVTAGALESTSKVIVDAAALEAAVTAAVKEVTTFNANGASPA